MKIAIMTSLLAEWDMDVDAGHVFDASIYLKSNKK
jgi:hypothetical protein